MSHNLSFLSWNYETHRIHLFLQGNFKNAIRFKVTSLWVTLCYLKSDCIFEIASQKRKFTKIRHFYFLQFSWPVHENPRKSKIRPFYFLQFSWIRVHEKSQKSDTSIFFNFHDPGYTKILKNQTLRFSSIFMTRVHENPQKSDALIFFNFHDPGYTKIHKNQTLLFSSIFMNGTWKITKIRHFYFLQFSWPRVHENPQKSDTLIFFNFHDPGYTKIHKNQTLLFSSIFMNPGTWKITKIRHFYFLQLSWPQVRENPQKSDTSIFFNLHEKSQKSDNSIFFNFHDPGYTKIHKNQTLLFSSIFMTSGTWQSTKIRHFYFLQLSWPRVHENPQKSDTSIFFNFHVPGYKKIHKNQTLWFLQFSWPRVHENPQKSDTSIFFNFHDPG